MSEEFLIDACYHLLIEENVSDMMLLNTIKTLRRLVREKKMIKTCVNCGGKCLIESTCFVKECIVKWYETHCGIHEVPCGDTRSDNDPENLSAV